MCLIAIGTVGQLQAIDLDAIWGDNPHGAGLVLPHPVRPIVFKGIMKLGALKRQLDKWSDDSQAALHVRWATHGAVNRRNAHPHRVNYDTWLMHNGVLSQFGKAGQDGESDSAHLARILSYLPLPEQKALLNQLDGRFALIHRDEIWTSGIHAEHKGVKMSNLTWMSKRHGGSTWYHCENGRVVERFPSRPADAGKEGVRPGAHATVTASGTGFTMHPATERTAGAGGAPGAPSKTPVESNGGEGNRIARGWSPDDDDGRTVPPLTDEEMELILSGVGH